MKKKTEKKTKVPHPREGLFNLLVGESHRGTALVAGEACNECVGSLLERLFVDSESSRKLLRFDAALGTFSSRIRACYALGLISDDEHADLNQS